MKLRKILFAVTLLLLSICFNGCKSNASQNAKDNLLANDNLLIGVTKRAKEIHDNQIGYPVNENIELDGFYKWYVESGTANAMLNNAGDPNDASSTDHGAIDVEREVIKTFAPLYGFDKSDVWGLVTASGTDGNNHGIYFGRHYLKAKTNAEPILYVSDASHYSNMRLAELQQMEVKLIETDDMGRMIPDKFRDALDKNRPALIVFSMGTTFKGGIDDQEAINKIIEEANLPAVYCHVDAALFGGYLPFSDYASLVDKKVCGYDSIAISGHKFFGIDEPCGLFFTSKEVLSNQNPYEISYLNASMPMINCSRSALNPLKFYYVLKVNGIEGFKEQTKQMMENTSYLKNKLDAIDWPAYVSCKESNTVFFKRPSENIMKKYYLAPDYDENLGGELAHIVVMQNITKEKIDEFIKDITKDK